MGNNNSKSKPLNLNQTGIVDASDGILFANIDNVWNPNVLEDCDGAFDRLVQLRQGPNKAPLDIRKLAEVCCHAWDKGEDEEARKYFMVKEMAELRDCLTQVTGQSSKGASSKKLSKAEKQSASTFVNMFGHMEKHMQTRAHQLPSSPAGHIFWGKVCEVVSGIQFDGYNEDKKMYVLSEKTMIACRSCLLLVTLETLSGMGLNPNDFCLLGCMFA